MMYDSPTFSQPRLLLFASVLALGLNTLPVAAQPTAGQKCHVGKLKFTGKYAKCSTNVGAKAIAKTVSVDAVKQDKCESKLDLGGFSKLEAKYGAACPTSGDATTIQSTCDDCVANVVAMLGGVPGPGGSEALCQSKKAKLAGKYMDCLLKTQAKANLKGLNPDFSKCETKLDLSYTKLETKGPCLDETGTDAGLVRDELYTCFDAVLGALSNRTVETFEVDTCEIDYGFFTQTVHNVQIDLEATPSTPPLEAGMDEDIALRVLEVRFPNGLNGSGIAQPETWSFNSGSANVAALLNGTGSLNFPLIEDPVIEVIPPFVPAAMQPSAPAYIGGFSIDPGVTSFSLTPDNSGGVEDDTLVFSGTAESSAGGGPESFEMRCEPPINGELSFPVLP